MEIHMEIIAYSEKSSSVFKKTAPAITSVLIRVETFVVK